MNHLLGGNSQKQVGGQLVGSLLQVVKSCKHLLQVVKSDCENLLKVVRKTLGENLEIFSIILIWPRLLIY